LKVSDLEFPELQTVVETEAGILPTTTSEEERKNEVEELKNLYDESVSPSGPTGPPLT
jgi:hypothetical protein